MRLLLWGLAVGAIAFVGAFLLAWPLMSVLGVDEPVAGALGCAIGTGAVNSISGVVMGASR